MSEYINNVVDKLRPQYNELTTFLTALSCLFLAITQLDFRLFYLKLFAEDISIKRDELFICFGLIASAGFVLSLYHVFTKRKKNFIEVTAMCIFIMGANGLSGIFAGIELLSKQWSILLFFPLWNILTGLFLLYQIGSSSFTVTDENATIPELLAGSCALFIIFALANFKLHLSWAMMFSLAMCYSSIAVLLISWIKKPFININE
jgi:hypothetical protein